MHLSTHAANGPSRPAVIMAATGETVTYGQLDARSNQGAHLFRSLGLKRGDIIAILLDNHPRYLEVAWAAQRSGLYYTCISSKVTADEVAYILSDSKATLLITSSEMNRAVLGLTKTLASINVYMVGPPAPAYPSFEVARSAFPETPIPDEAVGSDMLYTSGTTGRQKGVKPPLSNAGQDDETRLELVCRDRFGFSPEGTYLCPAPLYHSAPLRFSMTMHRLGGTVIVMDRFDPEAALSYIERFKVDCAQFVPTHFIRMLKLPGAIRDRYDISSLKSVVHSSAPCPVPVKETMIEWWGPIIHEYYSGTEGNGLCCITSQEWLEHKGSVGRAVVGIAHVCDDDGEPVPARTEGLVYFEGGAPVAYHDDPVKTAETYNRHGWSTLGDVGWLDDDGYLYLTDRKSFLIISGGVNIYPQEIENMLVRHPKVYDVAVVGAPHDEMGEQVVAVVQPAEGVEAGADLADELMAYAHGSLSYFKVPRRIDFVAELPRHATGKLYKRLIRDAYWSKA